jgi:hypothetical protein
VNDLPIFLAIVGVAAVGGIGFGILVARGLARLTEPDPADEPEATEDAE